MTICDRVASIGIDVAIAEETLGELYESPTLSEEHRELVQTALDDLGKVLDAVGALVNDLKSVPMTDLPVLPSKN